MEQTQAFVQTVVHISILLALAVAGGGAVYLLYRRWTQRSQEDAFCRYEKQFQRLLSHISRSFVAAAATEYPVVVQRALAQLGEFFAVDRTYIFEFSPDYQQSKNTYEWCAPGIAPAMDTLQCVQSADFPWWVRQLRSGCVIHVPDVDAMPQEALNERETLQRQGIQSVLVVPMLSQGRLTGFLGFDSVRNVQVWHDVELRQLQMAAEIIQNALDRCQMERRLLESSTRDSLTGLYNRRYLEKRLAALEGKPVSLVIVDVDGLKVVNDGFGPLEGDKLLRAAAEVLRQTTSRQETTARWGGDELIVLVERADPKYVQELAARLRAAAKNYIGLRVRLSLSVGWAVRVDAAVTNQGLLKEAEDRMYSMKATNHQSSRSALVQSLQKALQEKSHETEAHSQNLCRLALAFGQRVGLSEHEQSELQLLALLHDLGKVGIPEQILNKPGPLTQDEWRVMHRHPEIGYRIALSCDELVPIAEGILRHHTAWDGKGYPFDLRGDEIPLPVRMVSLVDAYDAMTSDRPYREALSPQHAVEEIRSQAGIQFDPKLATEFLELINEQPELQTKMALQ